MSGNEPNTIPIHPSIVAIDPATPEAHLEAFNQGHDAFVAGYPSTANPYALNPKTRGLADWWETGWMGYEEDEIDDD